MAALTLVAVAGAAAGDLDPSFGEGGKVLTDLGSESADGADAVALQPDARIVAAGFSNAGGSFDFALVRYNADGSLDSGFGSGGIVLTDLGGYDEARAVALQPDGKIVAAGYTDAGGSFDFALVRYNADGSLDSGFGSGGIVLTDLGGNDKAYAVALQPDGRIVAAGSSTARGPDDFALVRYDADGSLDSSFGSGGKVLTDVGGYDAASAVALQPDGRIVAAGYSGGDFALVRHNADGSLDSGFGSGGRVRTDLGGYSDGARAVALQPDARIVAAGYSCYPNCDFALVRYNADGSLDSGFGSGGIVLTDLGGAFDGASAVALQSDGRIVAAGFSDPPRSADFNFALVRYNADGSLDSGFGSGGKVRTDFGRDEEAWAVALQPDGRIVAAGLSSAARGRGYDFALARYRGCLPRPWRERGC